jgi:membrane protease YdiL (CAAX protease family)
VSSTTKPLTERAGVGDAVRRHPVVSFFVLAYGMSWLAWLPYVLATNTGLGVLPLRIPALLGSTQITGMLPGAYLGPITAALVVTAVAEGRVGLRRWARRLVRWRVNWRWYLLVVAGVPATLIAVTFLLPAAWHAARPPTTGIVLYPLLLLLQFATTGVAEEPGWRDFALPRLQRRLGPLPGSLLLGVLWAGWHLPLFLSDWGGWPDVRWYDPVEFVATGTALSISMTWVFNRTGESLPMVMLLHAGINATFSYVWTDVFPSLDAFRGTLHVLLITTVVVGAVLVAATRGRLGAHLPPGGRVPPPAPPRTA